MILCKDVYELLLDIARKDKRGKSLEVDEFNRAAVMVDKRVYAHYYKMFEESLDSSDALAGFKVTNYTVSLTNSATLGCRYGSLPSGYYNLIGSPRYSDSGTIREVDVVTNLEWTKRQVDYITRPTVKHPIMLLGGEDGSGNTQVNVLPTTVTSIQVDYLEASATPFLDYYTDDTNLTYEFMEAAAQNVSIPSGYTYRDGSTGATTKDSLTVNFDWGSEDLPLLLSLFVQVLGWQLEDSFLVQVGNAEELKNTEE
jgi:hypothetical protein